MSIGEIEKMLSARAAALLMGAALTSQSAGAQTSPADAALAKTVLLRSIAYRTVEGEGQVPRLAAYYAGILRDAGFAATDLEITPMGETATLAATLSGSDPALKPLLLIGHMDVVAADAADWQRDPFAPVEENGYIFGRGAEDNKYDVAMMVTVLAGLKRSGWQPRRTVRLLLSGDEESHMATGRALAAKYGDAELLLNGDAGGGLLDEGGRPVFYQLQAGEKGYADFEISFSDPGGHSSAPTPGNPLYRLARALDRIAAHAFPLMRNPLTQASLSLSADRVGGQVGDAMRRYARTGDRDAADLLSAYPEFVGQLRTTCVATMMQAGHARNALPQSAKANINCRVFPGVGVAAVRAELEQAVADPEADIELLDDPVSSDASPLRADVLRAVGQAVAARHPGIPIIPGMSAGATDSVWFRARGVPSYGVSGLYQRGEDGFAHGRDERVPVAGMADALDHWDRLIKALAQ